MLPTSNRTDLTPITSLPALYNPRDLALIRRTVAIDTSDDEFALFIHWARSLRLDPLRRQIHAFVFNKNDPKKRRLSLVTSIEGFRAIAARTGNYRPDENEPAFICDDALKSDNNPAGLVSCARSASGSSRITNGSRSPASRIGKNSRHSKPSGSTTQPTDRKALDKSGKWADMPFLMLAKCAEAQAIRKGWPEDLSNAFVGEEIDRASLNFIPLRPRRTARRSSDSNASAAKTRSSSTGSTTHPSTRSPLANWLTASSPSSVRAAPTLKPSSPGASAIAMRFANFGRERPTTRSASNRRSKRRWRRTAASQSSPQLPHVGKQPCAGCA